MNAEYINTGRQDPDVNTDMQDPFINTDTLAIKTGIAASTWHKRRMTGDSPAYRKIGSRVIYRWSDVTAWIDAHEKRSTSDAA